MMVYAWWPVIVIWNTCCVLQFKRNMRRFDWTRGSSENFFGTAEAEEISDWVFSMYSVSVNPAVSQTEILFWLAKVVIAS